MDTQTQIDRLIELAIIQRSELKQLVEQLPQLREHLNAEVEKVFDETEPQLRAELEEWTTKQTADKTAALGVALEAKIADLVKSLEVSTQARYNAIIAEREENARLAAQAEAKIAEHAASLPSAVKEIVTAELARFPRAGEIDQLRKEFAEPRGLNPRGKWQAGESYNKLDLVTINGDSYTSNTDGNRTRPSRSSADWTLVAARGTGGGGGPTSLSELTTVPSDGDLLIGSGTSWVTSNLTAGAGISITVGPGAITISATDGDITLDDGTAASPSLHFTNDPDTGIYRPAANTLGISTSGVQRMYVDQNGITTVGAGGTFDGSVHVANGNANNPSFSFSSDQDTGFYRHGTNELGISIGGTEKAVMTSTTFSITPNVSTSGNLTVNGTGTQTLNGKLDVITAASSAANVDLAVLRQNYAGTAGHEGLISFTNISGTSVGKIGTRAVDGNNTSLVLRNFVSGSLADALTLSPSVATLAGNLTVSGGTIGTAASTDLVVQGGSSGAALTLGQGTAGQAKFIVSSTNPVLKVSNSGQSAGALVFGDGSTTAFNVGIARVPASSPQTYGGGGLGYFTQGAGNAGGHYWFSGDNSFGSQTELMRLNTSGNLLLKSNGQDSANGKLQLADHTTIAGGIGFGTGMALYLTSTYDISLDALAGNPILRFRNAGTEQFRLESSGSQAYFTASNSIIMRSAGVTALTLDSSQNATFAGKVGIGVSPSSWELNLKQSAVNSAIRIISPTALGLNDSSIYIAWASGSKALIAASYESTGSYKPLVLSAGGVDSLTLDTSGNATFAGSATIGDGAAKGLTVDSGSGQNLFVMKQAGTSKWVQYLNSGSLIWYNTNVGANALTLDTATSHATFASGLTLLGSQLAFTDDGTNIKATVTGRGLSLVATGSSVSTGYNTDFIFANDTSVAKYNGNLGIGITNPTARLHVSVLTGAYNSSIAKFEDTWSVNSLKITNPVAAVTGIQAYPSDAPSSTIALALNPSGSPVLIGTTTDTGGILQAKGSAKLFGVTAEDVSFDVGVGRSGNGNAFIDLVGDATYPDYGLRIIRGNTGANAGSAIKHRGTGVFDITCIEGAAIQFVPESGVDNYIGYGPTRDTYLTAKATGTHNLRDATGANWWTFDRNKTFIANTTAAPSSNPSGGGYLYVEFGALKYRGSSGTVTTIANA